MKTINIFSIIKMQVVIMYKESQFFMTKIKKALRNEQKREEQT